MKKTVLYPLTVIEVDLEGGQLTGVHLSSTNAQYQHESTALVGTGQGYSGAPTVLGLERDRTRTRGCIMLHDACTWEQSPVYFPKLEETQPPCDAGLDTRDILT